MNITRPLILAAFVALFVSGCSQPNDITRAKLEPQFGTAASDNASAVAKHSTGVYVVGTTTGNLHAANKGLRDVFIRKYDNSGRLLWGRQFGTAANEHSVEVATDANNNAYVVGSTGGSLARPLRGTSDIFVRKYTSSGKVAWTQQKGLDGDDAPGGVAVSGGFVYVVGANQGLGTVVYRLNPSGSTYWKKRFSTGSSGDVTVDGSGNVYVAGSIPATCEEPEFDWWDCTDVQLNKYNASGNLVWIKRLSLALDDRLEALTAYGSSVYLVEQTFDVPDDESYTHLVKLNTSGVIQWERNVGVADAYEEYITGRSDNVSADSSGAYVASTATTNFGDPNDPAGNRQAYEVTKYATNGSPVWQLGSFYADDETGTDQRIFGSVSGVLARGGGELYVAGTVGSAGRGTEAYLKRLNAATGTTVWQR